MPHRILGIGIIVLSFLAAWLLMELRQFSNAPLQVPEQGVNYMLNPGTSFRAMAQDLEQRGVVSSALYFRVIARWDDKAHKIRAGEYHIAPGTKPGQLLDQMISGKVISYSFTLVEGWTFQQALQAVREQEALQGTVENLTQEAIMERLGRPDEHPEGRFLADTYHFPRGTTDLALLQRAYGAMDEFLQQEWEQREADLPLKTPYEALILASIVEKETAVAEERPMIAGVFIRRLRKGMKLQTDPTVIYGMGERYNGNIRRRDLAEDTPYNTYVHHGLTPTPISMPGRDAIRAVLHPAEGKSLYFVAKGDGSHYFSATLQEHNQAVRKYQLKR
jgi:UPF0755 protein